MALFVRLCLLLFPIFSLFPFAEAGSYTGKRDNGLKIYSKKCVWCHGKSGKGDGPASKFLRPLPRDFSSGTYKFISSDLMDPPLPLDTDIFRAISNGLPGTAMPGWKTLLSESEIWDLVEAVKSFSPLFDSGIKTLQLGYSQPVPFSLSSAEAGRGIFKEALCYECHGKRGRGDGSRNLKDSRGERVWPRDLTRPWRFKGGASPEDIFSRVSNGLPGTPMPGFGKKKLLTERERWHLVNYILSINEGGGGDQQSSAVVSCFTDGSLPKSAEDPSWEKATLSTLPLSPNLVSRNRLYTPTNSFLKVKSLFNREGITFFIRWRDRTRSLLNDSFSELMAEGTPFEDGVAVQFPDAPDQTIPYLGHGDGSFPVRMLRWSSETGGKVLQGAGGRRLREAGIKSLLTAQALYSDGEWKVVLHYVFKGGGSSFFRSGRPVAFANWDGSNGERGSRHTFTAWYPLVFEHKRSGLPYLFAVFIFVVLVSLQKLLRNRIRLIVRYFSHFETGETSRAPPVLELLSKNLLFFIRIPFDKNKS